MSVIPPRNNRHSSLIWQCLSCDSRHARDASSGTPVARAMTLRSMRLVSVGCALGAVAVLSIGALSGQAATPRAQGTATSTPAAADKPRALLDQVLRHLSQRPAQDREPVAAGARSDEGLRPRRALGESDSQAARGRDASARSAASFARGVRRATRLARGRDRSRRLPRRFIPDPSSCIG